MSGAKDKMKTAPRKAPEQVEEGLSLLQSDLAALARKIEELKSEEDEHILVLATLNEVRQQDPNRKCFRLVGGVLTERTVEDVIPALDINKDGIGKVKQNLTEQYKKKEEEFDSLKKELSSSSVITSY